MGNGQIRLARPTIHGQLGHQKGDKDGSHQTHASRDNQQRKDSISRNPTKSEWDLSTPERQPGRSNGVGCYQKKAWIQHLSQRIPTKDEKQFMPQMRKAATSSGGMPKPGQQQRGSGLGTKERQQKTMETTSQGQGNGGRKRRRIGKQRKSPVSNGLRDRSKPKPIEMRNLYAALNNTEALNNENNHIMVAIQLHGTIRQVTINAMIDSGATEDFIDKGFC